MAYYGGSLSFSTSSHILFIKVMLLYNSNGFVCHLTSFFGVFKCINIQDLKVG